MVADVTATRGRRFVRGACVIAGFLLLGLAAAFCVNGMRTSWRTPEVVSIAPADHATGRSELRVLAFNAAKCDFHRGGLSFASVAEVHERLDRIAETIRRERADLVCLSEIVMECGPRDVHQVEYLARKCGFAAFACGENYSFGLPFFRIRSGNALLSRAPLRAVGVQQLAGGTWFGSPTNNRRALWCEVQLGGEWLLVGSLRNDSFDAQNNARQTREILDFMGPRRTLLAGDLNAVPDSASLDMLRASGRFAPGPDRRPTFPRPNPTRRIDWILGPAEWTVVDESVVDCGTSDHLAVVMTFRLP